MRVNFVGKPQTPTLRFPHKSAFQINKLFQLEGMSARMT